MTDQPDPTPMTDQPDPRSLSEQIAALSDQQPRLCHTAPVGVEGPAIAPPSTREIWGGVGQRQWSKLRWIPPDWNIAPNG